MARGLHKLAPYDDLPTYDASRQPAAGFVTWTRCSGPGKPLVHTQIAAPEPGETQVLIRVGACAVCRTDLHVIDGELAQPKLPLVLGHEIVGVVAGLGAGVTRFTLGERVGVPWLGWTCGVCSFCRSDRENLCDQARFTGYHIDGGFAEFTVADQRFCFALPAGYTDVEAAPLLCAGLIGYRALRLAGPGKRIGIYGFGAAAHIIRVRLFFDDASSATGCWRSGAAKVDQPEPGWRYTRR